MKECHKRPKNNDECTIPGMYCYACSIRSRAPVSSKPGWENLKETGCIKGTIFWWFQGEQTQINSLKVA